MTVAWRNILSLLLSSGADVFNWGEFLADGGIPKCGTPPAACSPFLLFQVSGILLPFSWDVSTNPPSFF